MDKRLLNKKVIVTGGSRGIGAGIVERLYNEGAEIIIPCLFIISSGDITFSKSPIICFIIQFASCKIVGV